jgi:hypothetical protein
MTKLQIINWNILAECMRKFLKVNPSDLLPERRLEMTIQTLSGLIKKHPDALVALQEVSLFEEEEIMNLLKNYVIVRGRPSDHVDLNKEFWSGDQRREMSVLLAIPPSLSKYIEKKEIVDLVKQLPKQDTVIMYPEFRDIKGNCVGHSTFDELGKRTSLAASIVFNFDGIRTAVILTHDPCVFYMPEFQALVGECKKQIAKNLDADISVFVGDWNINHWNVKGEVEPLWTSFITGIPCYELLPKEFVGVTLHSLGHDDPSQINITNKNGEFESSLCHMVVFSRDLERIPVVVATELPIGSMKESGPNATLSSDHVPVLFQFFY